MKRFTLRWKIGIFVFVSSGIALHQTFIDAQAATVHRTAHVRVNASATTLLSDSFNGSSTMANRYIFAGDACLTAGISATPATSIPACGAAAPVDPAGSGALQLTAPSTFQGGFAVEQTNEFSTASGLVITFTDYSFGGSTPSADGMSAFLTDGGQPAPTLSGQVGGALGYANSDSGPGLQYAYLGIGLDEYGNFSSPTEGRNGGPGRVIETLAVRGAAASGYQYLTGYKNASGVAASLPFTFDQPAATTRPSNAATIQITLTAGGVLSVAIDHHDGNGFVTRINPTSIVGLNGQPALPATVRFGFASGTGGLDSRHQVGLLTITTIASTSPTPTPTPKPTPTPTPKPTPTPTPKPTPTPTATPVASTQDNVTYHNNNLRTGWYQHETTLTASNVGSSSFHVIATLATAGKSYSQPLYLSAQTLSNGSIHNVLIVTDATDVVYAYDADSLALLWKRDFKGTGIRQQLSSDVGCNDVYPNAGINGTPVADRSRNRLYVVVPTNENGVPHMRLHAISLQSGSDAVAPVEVAATVTLASGGTASVDPSYNYDRAGMLETNNNIYVPLSDHCDYDSDSTHGWVLSYSADTLAQTGSSINSTNKDEGTTAGVRFLGSIWEGGFGIAADPNGNVFFATGNGPNDNGGSDYGMSVVELPPSLNAAQRSFFTPANWLVDSMYDTDLGSGGVMLLPDQTTGSFVHLAIAGGKNGVKYLLNRDNLGGLNSTDQIPYETSTGGGIWGGPAYFVDSTGAQKILYGGSPTLNAYTLNTTPGYSLTQTSATNVGSLESHNNGGVTPVVSSNGTLAGTAIVWAIGVPGSSPNGIGIVTLYAFNATNLASVLYSAPAGQWTGLGTTGGAMITPLVANGRIYLATDGEITVFGIH